MTLIKGVTLEADLTAPGKNVKADLRQRQERSKRDLIPKSRANNRGRLHSRSVDQAGLQDPQDRRRLITPTDPQSEGAVNSGLTPEANQRRRCLPDRSDSNHRYRRLGGVNSNGWIT